MFYIIYINRIGLSNKVKPSIKIVVQDLAIIICYRDMCSSLGNRITGANGVTSKCNLGHSENIYPGWYVVLVVLFKKSKTQPYKVIVYFICHHHVDGETCIVILNNCFGGIIEIGSVYTRLALPLSRTCNFFIIKRNALRP